MVDAAGRRSKRLEQGDRSREDILNAATRLMAARGYDGTSISALAKESGLPVSSIYWHFTSKEGVLRAVMERGRRASRHRRPSPTCPRRAPAPRSFAGSSSRPRAS